MGVFESIEFDSIKTARSKSVKLALAENQNGMMIAIYPPQGVIDQLLIPDGESPEEMHITIAYLGHASTFPYPPEQILETLDQSLQEMHIQATTIHIEGTHTFPAKDGKYPLVAGVELSPGLQKIREEVVRLCDETPFKVDRSFPTYIPHITLKYCGETDPVPSFQLDPISFYARNISIVVAGQRKDIDIEDLW